MTCEIRPIQQLKDSLITNNVKSVHAEYDVESEEAVIILNMKENFPGPEYFKVALHKGVEIRPFKSLKAIVNTVKELGFSEVKMIIKG
ncbi:MAG: hypothetical protein MK175_20125 [Pseudoalteromonas sp.]|uniref:hypothetical protein n=1 Tax=Pseudoalteromonas sp. TaxID=53249 RepID=UPI0025FED5E2|nr:hypothetical protein [Pseudoalteromonas sp.]MCH2089496.1 hypothetical protein [Pseudoalteromonas sp.]